MNEKIVEISQMGAYLSLDRGFLSVDIKDSKEYKIPLDEIGGVIANSYNLSYSNNLLVKLAELNIPLVVCGSNHSPAGILWSVDPHFHTSGRIDSQINAKLPLYKRLWQNVVQTKIINQSVVLEALGKNHIKVSSLVKKVASGDETNVEGFAAKTYWQELFGKKFIRNRMDSGINAMLNYGYAIIRSGTARAIMGAGLHPAIGIFHKNKSNPMRLADDLMEPFRPIIDYKTYQLYSNGELEVNVKVKRELVNCLYMDMNSDKGRTPVINRILSYATSLAQSLEKGKPCLDAPKLSVSDICETET